MECIQLLSQLLAYCITVADKINTLLNEGDYLRAVLFHVFANQVLLLKCDLCVR